MSPRGFKLGLALFVLMSGLFGAKLVVLGGNGFRVNWSMTEILGRLQPSPAATQPSPEPAARPSPDTLNQNATAAAATEAQAAKETETAAHLSPPSAEQDAALVAAITRELSARGYAPGEAEPGMTLQARAAVMAFEADNDMRLTGEASQLLLHRLLLGVSPAGQANSGTPPTALAEDVIRTVQHGLRTAGHPDVPADGRLSTQTAESIRAFERANAMKVTGRISADLVARLPGVQRDATRQAGR
jgi:peptidoglycan hydrolase-like protein with peptidoglycan-binding domain